MSNYPDYDTMSDLEIDIVLTAREEEHRKRTAKQKVIGIVDFGAMKEGEEFELPIGFDDYEKVDGKLYYYKYIGDKRPPVLIDVEPGHYVVSVVGQGIGLVEKKIRIDSTKDYMKTISISEKSQTFLRNAPKLLSKFGSTPRRGTLLWGEPGTGKTTQIVALGHELAGTDGVYIEIPAEYPVSAVSKLFSSHKPTANVKHIIISMEDLGGGEAEYQAGAARGVGGDLLAFLDGNSFDFQVPTMIFATTNFPAGMLGNLVDRPGRFDEVLEVPPPNGEQRIRFIAELMERELDDLEKKAVNGCAMSVAHCKELVVKNILYGTSIQDAVKDIKEHKKKVAANFEEIRKQTLGFG